MSMNIRMITGHAGCENTPANTVENVKKAIEINCDALELDIRIYNGIIYCSHDKRTDSENFFTIDEAIELIKNSKIRVNCDIKEEEAFVQVIEKFRQNNLTSRMIMTGLFPDDFSTDDDGIEFYLNLNYLMPSDEISANPESAVTKSLRFAKKYGKQVNLKGFNMHYSWAPPFLTDALHENQLQISVWTPSDKESISAMIKLGADNITTRTPVLAQKLLNEFLI